MKTTLDTNPLTMACEIGQHKACYKGRHNGCESPHLHWCHCDCHPYEEPTPTVWERFWGWLHS